MIMDLSLEVHSQVEDDNPWRRGGDSNPRYPCEYTRFPSVRTRPTMRPLQRVYSISFRANLRVKIDDFVEAVFPARVELASQPSEGRTLSS